MNCACSVDVDLYDGDHASTTWCKIKKARVSHKCDECCREIIIGETYEHYTGFCDGAFFKYKTCSDCLSIRDVFFANGYYFGAVLEYFHEFINKNSGQVSEKCLSTLTPRARALACEHIQEIWTEYWLDYPTQPAFRLEQIIKRLRYRNDWMIERDVEIGKMDQAVWAAVDKARKAGLSSK